MQKQPDNHYLQGCLDAIDLISERITDIYERNSDDSKENKKPNSQIEIGLVGANPGDAAAKDVNEN